MHVGVLISSYKDSSHIGWAPILMTAFQLSHLFKEPISKYTHILSCWKLELEYLNLRGYNSAHNTHQEGMRGTSLVAQWLRIHLLVQGTWVWALVREDPTRRGATKPVCHNYWACALEPVSHNYWARVPQLLKPVRVEPVLCNKRSHCNEKPTDGNEDPKQPKINK